MKTFPLSELPIFKDSVLDPAWVQQFVGTDAVFDVRVVKDHLTDLTDAERQAVNAAVQRRRNTYSSGRACARLALAGIGVSRAQYPIGLLKQEDGSVAWPPGTIGSISHTDDIAIAAAAKAGRGVMSFGIDLEVIQRLKTPILKTIATDHERTHVLRGDSKTWEPAALFSVKESLYKCLRPHHGAFIGFRDVELSIPCKALHDGAGPCIYQATIRFLSEVLKEKFDERQLRARVTVVDEMVLSVVSYLDDTGQAT